MRSSSYEQELKNQGVNFTYLERLTFDVIDKRKGLANQARLEFESGLDMDLVQQYTNSFKAGAQFPALVVYQPGAKAKYVPIDGNHRLAAALAAGLDKYDAYVVDTKDQMVVDRITWSFNNHVNGLRLTPKESLEHAVTFVRKYGAGLKEAAKEWGVPEWKVRNTVRDLELREKLELAKVPNVKSLDSKRLEKLSVLEVLGDDILVPAAKVVITTGATAEQTEDLAKRVKGARTHAAKLAEIAAFESSDAAQTRRAETKNGTVQRRHDPLPRERLARLLRDLNKLLEDYPDRKALVPGAKTELVLARQTANEVCKHLDRVFGLGTERQIGG